MICKTYVCINSVCSVCLSVLSVTLMYCGQTVGWIKMQLGTEVGLGPGHIVLPNHVVLSDTVNMFKSRLDKFWQHQDLIYDFKAEISGTGSRSCY